ncbi:MAG: DUF1353 domain-containing protein [Pseudodesulfovibrio sp.]|uniref:DUF1353 domain-containing protein n=1 Tax=Pseudodesulfovibrio sp. TaxID=2035812 RepID=UPI003D134B68
MSPRYQIEFTPCNGVEVRIDPHEARRPFVLTRPLSMTLRGRGGTKPSLHITVPAGFGLDMASIPRLLWPVIPRDDRRIARAATVHDYLYDQQTLPRPVADSLFLAIMRSDGMPWFKRTACYLAVRLFGGRAWSQEERPA